MSDAKTPPQNPFERFGIDPREGTSGITARFRELIEDATGKARDELRKTWEELTLHPANRVRAALSAHPETRPELAGAAPEPPEPARGAAAELTLLDLVVLPSVSEALFPGEREPRLRAEATPLEHDPLLQEPRGQP